MPVVLKSVDGTVQSIADKVQEEAVEVYKALPEEAKAIVKQAASKAKVIDPESTAAFIIAAIQKQKGDGVVVKGSAVPDVKRIPTGIFEFDLGTGGGIPRGRITIIYGPESSGKTNHALKAAIYVQRYFPPECNKVVFVDLEGTFDPVWFTTLGGDADALIVVKPAYGEEAVDVSDALVRAEDVALLIYDSIAVTVATKELEKSTETADMGTSAILMKRMVNKIAMALAAQGRKGHFPAVILINQIRYKLGVMYGDPETTPGGMAIRFLSSLTVRLTGKNVADKKVNPDLPLWKETKAVIKKSKIAVTAYEFEYSMAMQPGGELDVGDTNSWNTVAGHLKEKNLLVKEKDGWRLTLPEYAQFNGIKGLLDLWRETYICDLGFRVACQQTVLQSAVSQKFLVAGE